MFGLVLALSASAFQRSSPHKLRATGLLELTTDSRGAITSRLYPITILADGRFHDATIYESKPRPMALGTGVVYEAQKTGTPVGYLTINGAINSLQGWVGEGKWQLPKDTTASSKPKPSTPPPDPSDNRPILHRGSGESAPPSPQPEQTPPSTPPSDDRPVLHRSGSDGPQQPASTPTPPASQPDAEAPPDPNRPVLRHRTPSGEDIESPPLAAKKADVPPAATSPSQTITTKPLPPPSPGVQTFLAVSDSQPADIRSYEFNWKADEKEKIEAKMRKLALAQLPGEKTQVNEHSLTNVVVRSFDLDLSNDAVVVITAEAPGAFLAPGGKPARAAAAPKATPDKSVSRYITVIARVDIDGNPQKLASSVTDSSRLDVAPRLELVDAVDVDGDGLAELVFREYDFDQKSFLIYGVGHGSVTKVFEGASVPLNSEK
ncbi:MAG TPA: hypothetical protein VI636_11905 [Candidatus Angelobacter sp.]